MRLRERLEPYVPAFESHWPDSHFGAHLRVHAEGHVTAAAARKAAPIWLGAARAALTRQPRSAKARLISFRMSGNFLPATDELFVRVGLAPPSPPLGCIVLPLWHFEFISGTHLMSKGPVSKLS